MWACELHANGLVICMSLKTKALQIFMDAYKHNVHPLAEDDGHVS